AAVAPPPHASRPSGPKGPPGPRAVDVTRIYVGLGRQAGIRPADLVGAIANEAGLASREIGPIQIADRFSLVGVPTEAAERVIGALRGAAIRGKKALVRRDRVETD
ncbi:MAG: DbpA RNA binding domain-containing protein, partial [Vulcanimicrobiaceae bacterium]